MKNYQYDKTPINLTKEEYLNHAGGNLPFNKDLMAKTLLKEARYLYYTIRTSQQVPEEQQKVIINDTAANLIYMMELGKIPSQSYDLYKNYMFVTLRNFISNYHRKQKRDKERIIFNSEEFDLLSEGLDEQITEDMPYRLLEDISSLLKPNEKELLQLILEGFKTREIALKLDIGTEAAKARIFNLRQKIKTQFLSNNPVPEKKPIYKAASKVIRKFDKTKELEFRKLYSTVYKKKKKE